MACSTRWLASVLLAACGSDAPPVVSAAFEITSPDITIEPHEEVTYCYFFRTPNTKDALVTRWASTMTPGSHHLILYTTQTDVKPPGSISRGACGGFSLSNASSWTYAAQLPVSEITLPTDDGEGRPLVQSIPANTPAYIQMHYLNSGDEPIQAHVTITADGVPPDTDATLTAAFVTYNNDIEIPPHAVNHVETMSCNTPQDTKFWLLSTHAHKQAIRTAVKAGGAVAFESDDWEHPGAKQWMSPPYHTFTGDRVTYECTYANLGDNADNYVTSGPSADTNEMCMATGYYFPAEQPRFCFNGIGPL